MIWCCPFELRLLLVVGGGCQRVDVKAQHGHKGDAHDIDMGSSIVGRRVWAIGSHGAAGSVKWSASRRRIVYGLRLAKVKPPTGTTRAPERCNDRAEISRKADSRGAQEVIDQHQRDHRLAHRHEPRQQARVVPALHQNLRRLAGARDGPLRSRDAARRLDRDAADDRHRRCEMPPSIPPWRFVSVVTAGAAAAPTRSRCSRPRPLHRRLVRRRCGHEHVVVLAAAHRRRPRTRRRTRSRSPPAATAAPCRDRPSACRRPVRPAPAARRPRPVRTRRRWSRGPSARRRSARSSSPRRPAPGSAPGSLRLVPA